MLKRLVSKVSRYSEVKLITFQNNRVTVVVDRVQVNTYIRVNGLVEAANRKLYFGEPMTAAVRDDVTADEFRQLLQQPGVLFIRADALQDRITRAS